jgi:hypothetical protein
MKFFKNWFAKMCREAWENSRQDVEVVGITKASRSIDTNGMNFTVYRANGGHVIETRKYDRKRDENNNSLHIITDDKDLGEEIGKIITFENLRS